MGDEGSMARRRRPGSSLLASPLESDDILSEVLLRLPPAPSSLPHVSLVCKRWRCLVSDRIFLRRFRARHRLNAPRLGFFTHTSGNPSFTPTLDPPDRLPRERFSLEFDEGCYIVGCRHGLVLILNRMGRYLLVWDPVTSDVSRVAFPPSFGDVGGAIVAHGAGVLRAASNVRDGDHRSTPFSVALVAYMVEYGEGDTRAFACLYSSETGLWGDVTSTTCETVLAMVSPSALVGSSLYWVLGSGLVGILEFDLDRQRLAVINGPPDIFALSFCNWVMATEDGSLGFLCLSGYNAELWRRKKGSDGVARWVLGRTVELDKLLSLNMEAGFRPLILGFAEEDNMSFLSTRDGVFMVQLESMQFKKLFELSTIDTYYSFSSVYTAGLGIDDGPQNVDIA